MNWRGVQNIKSGICVKKWFNLQAFLFPFIDSLEAFSTPFKSSRIPWKCKSKSKWFQFPNTRLLHVLLSSNAGGTGLVSIWKVTVDQGCILFDVDWNPASDLQKKHGHVYKYHWGEYVTEMLEQSLICSSLVLTGGLSRLVQLQCNCDTECDTHDKMMSV